MTRIIFLLAISLFSYNFGISQCQPGTLFGVNGGSEGEDSRLFTLNLQTGTYQIIGNTGFTGVKGIAIHPTTCDMYGVAKPDGSSGSSVQLLKINLNNGAGTPIGSPIETKITDLTFSPSGVLYAWDRTNNRFLIVNLQNADTTQLADLTAIPPWNEIGVAFDKDGNLYAKDSDKDLYRINPSTGEIISSVALSGANDDLDNSLAVNNQNVMYSIDHAESSVNSPDDIYRINPSTGLATFVVSTTVSMDFEDQFTAIEFCPEKPIPTLSQWGMIILGLSLAIIGMVAVLGMRSEVRGCKQ